MGYLPTPLLCLAAWVSGRALARPQSFSIRSDPGALAPRAYPGENRVMAADIESTLLGGNVARDQRHRDVHIEQNPACQAVDVVMPFDTPIVPACLIRERQLLNET